MQNNINNLINNSPVYDVAKNTPLEKLETLSSRFNNHIYLKREDQQPVHSFKLRGAYQKIRSLSTEERNNGIVAASAGNHAQGVAFSAKKLDIDASIFMPTTTPEIKINAVKTYGVNVILEGDNYDQACDAAQKYCAAKGKTFIHPYDDPHVIAGQGTVAKEILDNLLDNAPDIIFVPTGGGGLLAGVASYVKAVNPAIKVIGVEPDNSACMSAALAKKERIILDEVGIFADGVAVRQAGELPFNIALETVDDMIMVSTDEICAAIKDIYESNRTVTEPAGSVGLAGLKKYIENNNCKNKTLVTIASGANLNFDRLRHVAERAEIGEHKEAIFAVTIPETPGSFKKFCALIGSRSVTEFNYRYHDNSQAHIFVGIALKNGLQEQHDLLHHFTNAGYDVTDLTLNETAKIHIRYMVGGKASQLNNECCFRVQFPEKPGALLHFLNQLGEQYNISMFHYRNHGADYGRVLIGIQDHLNDPEKLSALLTGIGYRFTNETENKAYQLFL